MGSYPALSEGKGEHLPGKAHITALEADIAYFQARLEILGEPETINQVAQRRLFLLLHAKSSDLLLNAKRRMLEGG
jgi:hypothetical protein